MLLEARFWRCRRCRSMLHAASRGVLCAPYPACFRVRELDELGPPRGSRKWSWRGRRRGRLVIGSLVIGSLEHVCVSLRTSERFPPLGQIPPPSAAPQAPQARLLCRRRGTIHGRHWPLRCRGAGMERHGRQPRRSHGRWPPKCDVHTSPQLRRVCSPRRARICCEVRFASRRCIELPIRFSPAQRHLITRVCS